MSKVFFLNRALMTIVVLLIIAMPARANINPFTQETGKISISLDAIGTNAPSGVLQVEKPIGGTVRKAFFSCASNFRRIINDGDVAIDGIGITWDTTVFNNAGTNANFFHNTLANVTNVVKAKIDGALPGRVDFTISESSTNTIDGCILAVIFDDPGQIVDRTAILLFGGQDTLGDTFVVNLVDPIDKTDQSLVLDFGLGISFGAQDQSGNGGSHLCGTQGHMSSLVDVNGVRLTSCAGNLDDGVGPVQNGALVTVGGLDDTNTNPSDPFQQAADGKLPRVEEDELYDLIPFVSTGDTAIQVDTINPSNDDNIFFAYFFTSGPSAVLPNIPPPGARSIVTDNIIGFIDPSRPTIVLTHGFQNKDSTPGELWTGFGDDNNAGTLLRNLIGNSVNILQFIWEEGNTISGIPTGKEYIAARQNVSDAAQALANILADELGPGYSQSIHFIGHSLGTAVNAYAARSFLAQTSTVTTVQFTILDYPNNIDKNIPGISKREESIYGFDANFFASVLPAPQLGLDLRIDNYYSLTGVGVGDRVIGELVYNHDATFDNDDVNGLEDPNDVGSEFFKDEEILGFIDNDLSRTPFLRH